MMLPISFRICFVLTSDRGFHCLGAIAECGRKRSGEGKLFLGYSPTAAAKTLICDKIKNCFLAVSACGLSQSFTTPHAAWLFQPVAQTRCGNHKEHETKHTHDKVGWFSRWPESIGYNNECLLAVSACGSNPCFCLSSRCFSSMLLGCSSRWPTHAVGIGRSVGRLVGRSVDLAVSQHVACCFGRSVGRS